MALPDGGMKSEPRVRKESAFFDFESMPVYGFLATGAFLGAAFFAPAFIVMAAGWARAAESATADAGAVKASVLRRQDARARGAQPRVVGTSWMPIGRPSPDESTIGLPRIASDCSRA